ncbi:hypothetical protein BVRB_5g113590 [Beta vulgaris subsp. vulgaris]|uniref:Uncharacterized protein n=1 Tax=Beta vulgaris subsp. vulgaris TaxID=3555 RepID=A0A0J8F4U2_BETVV|nr:hypothetical protein BVRB_5g113590 [Beta vulgaris subsp. vulgaris]
MKHTCHQLRIISFLTFITHIHAVPSSHPLILSTSLPLNVDRISLPLNLDCISSSVVLFLSTESPSLAVLFSSIASRPSSAVLSSSTFFTCLSLPRPQVVADRLSARRRLQRVSASSSRKSWSPSARTSHVAVAHTLRTSSSLANRPSRPRKLSHQTS